MFTDWTDIDVYRKELERTAFDDPKSLTNINKGHTITTHTDLNDMELVKRMLSENKDITSNFADIKDYTELNMIGDAIINQSVQISDWACSKRNEFSDPRDYNKFVMEVDLGYPEPIGYGFKSDLQKYATDTIRVVLQRDNSGENQFGFYVLTAYPCVEKGYPEETKFEEKDLIEKKNELSVLEKVKLGLKGYPVETRIYYDNYTEKQKISISFSTSKMERFIAYMAEDELKIKHIIEDKFEPVSKAKIKAECPELAGAINKAELFRDVALAVKVNQDEEKEAFLVQKTCKKKKQTVKLI